MSNLENVVLSCESLIPSFIVEGVIPLKNQKISFIYQEKKVIRKKLWEEKEEGEDDEHDDNVEEEI